MSDKIVLLDGHSLLNRAFYGIPLLTNSAGIHTNAVYGFLNILFKILDEEQAQYLAVAFDLHAPTFRHKRYEAYKGTRHAMPDELREQVPLMKDMLTAMGVPLMMLEGYEADDLIGTISRKAEEQGLDVRVISGDRDLLQLASDRTMIRIPKTKKSGTEVEDYFAKDVQERYLVTPEEFVQVKALMGDASDNIPGIPGVGEKTATKIIAQYHSIDNAHDHLDEIKPARAQASLRDYWEDAKLSEWLAAIDRNAPFELDFEQAKLDPDHAALYTPKALELCRELELRTMVNRFLAHMDDAVQEEPVQRQRPCHIVIAPKPSSGFGPIGDFFMNPDEATQDPETEKWIGKIADAGRVGLQILYEENRLIGAAFALKDEDVYFAAPDASLLQELVGRCSRIDMIDMKEQLAWLDEGNGFDPGTQAKFFDAAIGAYLINPLQDGYSYDAVMKTFTGELIPSQTELLGKKRLSDLAALAYDDPAMAVQGGKKSKDTSGPADRDSALNALVKFACLQAQAALVTEDRIREELREEGMERLFDEIEMPLVFVLYHMQKEGILVRAEELREYGEKLTGRIAQLEADIYAQAGQEFNINSPKQLGQVLFEELHLPYGKKTKTGYSTAADVLDKLAEQHPIVADILEYRQLTKLKSTYADGLSAYIAPDGRIHGRFNQTITATGRISSTDPNLQNIPVRTELGRELRRVFVPKEGAKFVDADYSQIELRVLAHVSGDESLIRAYNSAEDIHAITASEVFHVPLEEVTPQLRRNAKAVNFGIVYGISSFGLSQGLSITRQEAAEFIEQYFKTFPGIKAFLDESVAQAREKGYSVTMFGRRRPIPELKESNFMRRSFGERVAMNAPIQGAAADIIKIAMVGVDRALRAEGLKSRLVLQVHDELLVEAAEDEVLRVQEIIREKMEGAASMKVRLEIDMHTGDSWFDAH